MNWQSFPYFAIAAVLCWLAGTYSAFRKRQRGALMLSGLGSAIFLVFIIGFWMALDRPPLRTMGETRLWYSFFLSVVGIGLYGKCRYPWMLGFSTLMSLVFTLINILKPEIHSQTLMPALQSLWFVPHVIVYMFSYAMLGAATLFALFLWLRKSPEEPSGPRRHGATTGLGTPRRHGPWLRGSAICSICICAQPTAIIISYLLG